jgi:hypothetical protein
MADNIHRKQFANGRLTPIEMHRKLAFRGKCKTCGGPPAIHIKVFVEVKDLQQRQPHLCALICAQNPDGPFIPITPMTYGQMVMVSELYACDNCKAEAEKAAARGPNWCLVEISRGPKETFVVQVPQSYKQAQWDKQVTDAAARGTGDP